MDSYSSRNTFSMDAKMYSKIPTENDGLGGQLWGILRDLHFFFFFKKISSELANWEETSHSENITITNNFAKTL